MEPSTVKWLSEKLGKETIKSHSYNMNNKSAGESYQNLARSLLTPDEIEQMARSCELVFVSGCKPIQTKKYDLRKHPNFQYSGEADSKNNLNINDRFKDNVVDIDELDDFTLTEDDITEYNFALLKSPKTKKQKSKEDKSQENNSVEESSDFKESNNKDDNDNKEVSEPISNNEKNETSVKSVQEIAEEEHRRKYLSDDSYKDRRSEHCKKVLENVDKNFNQSIEQLEAEYEYGKVNFEFVETGYAFEFSSAKDMSIDDFDGLVA